MWFKLSNTTGHKYYVEIDDVEKTIKIITGVKIRVRWQRKAEKHGKRQKKLGSISTGRTTFSSFTTTPRSHAGA